ncbi:MAG: hypothetical protein CK425_11230 [Parachlamydia sp.]|nr:MAG: hypothetical protein CK425_11230 [Parachlamydia sp.]
MDDDDLDDIPIPGTAGLPLRLDSHLFEKLENHLYSLKILCKGVSRNSWIIEAITEKLNDDVIDDRIPKMRRIHLDIPSPVKKKLEAHVQNLKKIHQGFSQKQLIIDAIYEKFDREQKEVKEELRKLREAKSNQTEEHRSKKNESYGISLDLCAQQIES